MNKTLKIVWGILTVLPIVLFATGMAIFFSSFIPLFRMAERAANTAPSPTFMLGFFGGYILVISAVVLNFGMNFTYYIHLVRNSRIDPNEKTVWVCVFLVFHTLAMAVYWFLRVWPESRPVQGSSADDRGESRSCWDLSRILRWLLVMAFALLLAGAVFLAILWKFGPLDEVLAVVQKARHRPDKAIALYEHALRRTPQNVRIKSRLAKLWYERKDRRGYEAAIRLYEDCIHNGSKDYEVHFWLGCAYRHVGDNESSLLNLNEAVRLRPGNYYAYLNRGLARGNLGDKEGAMADYNKCITLSDCKPDAFINRGVLYQERGKYSLALADYNSAIAADSQSRNAHNNRGNTLRSMGRYEESLASFAEAIRLEPNNGSTYRNRALTYGKMGKKEMAQKDRETASRLPGRVGVFD